ncbi:MAG: FAD-dependent oxidoreductase, partial [Kofleriaceae bacterium]
MRIAIVGAGIAGLGAAHVLAGPHEVTMFEATARAGGHVYTVDVDGVAVDMGFIVHNREHYPLFCALLRELGIATRPTTMAFSVVDGDHAWGSGSLSAMFADRRKLASPGHWRFLVRVMRFLATARRDLAIAQAPMANRAGHVIGRLVDGSLDEYLLARDVPREVRAHFVIPLAAALWSLAPEHCGAFPAITFFAFLDQHGMLSPARPLAWHSIIGGSRRYVDALIAMLGGRPPVTTTGARAFRLELATPVRWIVRDSTGVALVTDGGTRRFDRVIVATHADTALALLAEATADEREALGKIRYSANRTVLHTDRSFLPRQPAAHASWNYVADPDTTRVNVTYSMTRLQGLPDRPYLVTLNPRR